MPDTIQSNSSDDTIQYNGTCYVKASSSASTLEMDDPTVSGDCDLCKRTPQEPANCNDCFFSTTTSVSVSSNYSITDSTGLTTTYLLTDLSQSGTVITIPQWPDQVCWFKLEDPDGVGWLVRTYSDGRPAYGQIITKLWAMFYAGTSWNFYAQNPWDGGFGITKSSALPGDCNGTDYEGTIAEVTE